MRSADGTLRTMPRGIPALVGTASLVSALIGLSGCAVGPDFKSPEVKVASDWSARSDPRVARQAVDTVWWREFRDPALDHLVDLAYRQNLGLQTAGLRVAEARAQLGYATGLYWPQVQEAYANASVLGLTKQIANYVGVPRTVVGYQIGFDAAWELDVWGKFRRGVESASDSLLASVADYYASVVSITAEVARTYALIRTYEVLLEEARENVALQEDGLRIAESRFRNGATSELDVTQARTLLESTRATIPQLQIGVQQSRNALATLLGQPVGSVDALLGGPQDVPSAPTRVAVSVPAEMLRRRPDVRSAELRAAAQCARIGVAKADLYPSFSLVGDIGLSAGSAGSFSRSLFSTDSLFYTAGPRINWPLFNYGRIENNVRVEDARFQQLLVEYHDTVLRAVQEVEDALVGFLDSQDAVAFEQRSVTAAQRSVEIAMVQYQEGAVDYQRVLDSERTLLQQQNALTQARSSVVTNLVALYKALGGGWEVTQGKPFVTESTQKEMKERTNWGDMLSQPRGPEKH